MSSLDRLPPPVVFTHGETLHAIALPPLASFLSSLSSPEHFVTLQDLLDRYRTPKSYHRIDVRLVASSELPPGSAGGSAGGSPTPRSPLSPRRRQRLQREKGEPIELPPSSKQEEAAGTEREISSTVADIQDQDGHDGPSTSQHAHNMAASAPVPEPIESPPTSPYPPPPSGPTRRVRELRLDLRSLDAAALFQLETWRREVMGLERLDLDAPDSIWYKDASPSPPLAPSAIPIPNNRGSSQEEALTEAVIAQSETAGSGLDAVAAAKEFVTGDQLEGYNSLVDALTTEGVVLSTPTGDTKGTEAPVSLSEALGQLAQQVVNSAAANPSSFTAPDQPPETQAGPSKSASPDFVHSPSPDIMLNDAYNEKEVDDPDFIPAASPEPRSRRSRQGTQQRSGRRSRVSFDLSNLQLIVNPSSDDIDVDGEVSPAPRSVLKPQMKRTRGRLPKSAYDEMGRPVRPGHDRGPTKGRKSVAFAEAMMSAEGGEETEVERSTKRRKMIVDVVIPTKKRRSNINNPSPDTTTPDEFVVTKNASALELDNDSDGDDGEWSFLMAIK